MKSQHQYVHSNVFNYSDNNVHKNAEHEIPSHHQYLTTDFNTRYSVSPLVLKRSSLIKYDDNIPFADASLDMNNALEIKMRKCPANQQPTRIDENVVHFNHRPVTPLYKTGSISSLKVSALTECWPSSEYVRSGGGGSVSKIRTYSNCDHDRANQLSTDFIGDGGCFPYKISVADSDLMDSAECMNDLTNSSVSFKSGTEIAKEIMNDGGTADKTRIASYLSNGDDQSKSVAMEIMKQLDFSQMSLVEALQKFSQKIPVIGESQERERILTHFTKRYLECNINSFKNIDACHTLVCAIMLLNTDLHGQISKKKMSCKEFVENLMNNYGEYEYRESDLVDIYYFIKKVELKNDSVSDESNTLRRKLSKLIGKSSKQPEVPLTVVDSNILNEKPYISGNIMRKCIRKAFGKRPALGHRGWKLQFASLIGLQLLIFKTNLNQNDSRSSGNDDLTDKMSITDSNISSELLQNDNTSLCLSVTQNAKSVISKMSSSSSREHLQVSVEDVDTNLRIHHAYATIVEKLKHKNVFQLRLADQAEYLFKVKSGQLHLWVNTINHVAALLSAPPIMGAGQSGVYKPLMPGYPTDQSKEKQIETHLSQIQVYRDSLKKLHTNNAKNRGFSDDYKRFCVAEIARFETYVELLKSPTPDDFQKDQQITRCPDFDSLVSNMEPINSSTIAINYDSPRSLFTPTFTSHDCNNTPDLTLRRRPPKIPAHRSESASRIRGSSSNQIFDRPPPPTPPHHLQNSPTSDSLFQRCIWNSQSYVDPNSRPVPQSGYYPCRSQQQPQPTVTSFSRFIEPSCTTFSTSVPTPMIKSPLTVTKSSYQSQKFSVLPPNRLPQYSPPTSRKKNNF